MIGWLQEKRMLQQQTGYEVLYHPFNGSHTVPEVIVPKALDWFTASSQTESRTVG
ncbi:hypothetical protein QUB10_06160 [Microcoleus sp. B5-D4]|uniref:hypothetical protein n=1 Tax=Microcoleus sp. B5-D4 TaxID=2818681 RepID=UPI002FD05B18